MDYISMNNISMDTVRTYTELMLTRRGYTIGDFMDTDEGIPGKKPRLEVTKPDGTKAIVFFVHKKNKADKVTKKSWVYMKRAHLHSLTMGVISIVLSLVVAGLAFPPLLQFTVSFLSGLGALGYGLFWMIAGFLAPGLGSTSIAKDTIALLAQVSALSFMIAAITLFCFFGYRVFSYEKPIQETKE